jgi:uncharacterized protein YkwD
MSDSGDRQTGLPAGGDDGGVDATGGGEDGGAGTFMPFGGDAAWLQSSAVNNADENTSYADENDSQTAEVVRSIVDEINNFRRNPRAYAKEMSKLQNCYKAKFLTYPESGLEIETVEGIGALHDCLQDLTNASPLPAMTVSQSLCRACTQHLGDLQANDFCSHIGTDGSTPEERLARYGEHREQCGENVVFGMRSPKETVYHMLIDDGSPERGHRANLLNMDFHFIGAAFGKHPSAETATALLLVDHFRARQVGPLNRMRAVVEEVQGEVLDAPGLSPEKMTRQAWDRLMQEVKPDHLAVPGRLVDHVHRCDRPGIYRKKNLPVPVYPMGELAAKPGIDPAIVRAFVHRIDENHDDCIVESELMALAHHHQLDVSKETIRGLFDEIILGRPWHERNRRSVDWAEIYAAMKTHKSWVPAVDIHVELDGDERYQLCFEADEFSARCSNVFTELLRYNQELRPPPAVKAARSDSSLTRNRSGAAKIEGLSNFLQSLCTLENVETEEPMSNMPPVQALFAKPGAGRKDPSKQLPLGIRSASAMGMRRLWAHRVRSHRSLWLLLHRVVGLHPLVALPIHRAPAVLARQSINEHIKKDVSEQTRRNVAKPDAKYTGVPTSLAGMAIKDAPKRLQTGAMMEESILKKMDKDADGLMDIREAAAMGISAADFKAIDADGSGTVDEAELKDALMAMSDRSKTLNQELLEERTNLRKKTGRLLPGIGGGDGAAAAPLAPWEDQRQQVENLVNSSLVPAQQDNSDIGPAPAEVAYSFESRRRFQQVNAKQKRASAESVDLGAERKNAKLVGAGSAVTSTGRLAAGGYLQGPHTASGLGPANHAARSCGAGAFSSSAPTGVRGHFHNSLAVHQKDGSHSWPQSLPAQWDGAHIDHARDPPQKAGENFGQPAKYATMTMEERGKQFSTYFKNPTLGSGATAGTHDKFTAKCKSSADQLQDYDKFAGYRPPEFRDDNAKRLGKYGRKDFDPQVREKPVRNMHNISQLEDKPMEEFFRQQERVDDFLNRAVPPSQSAHFKSCMPAAEKPLSKRHQMATRVPLHCLMDGEQKVPQLGWGQNRHSDETDFKLFCRGGGAGQMDKLLPMA